MRLLLTTLLTTLLLAGVTAPTTAQAPPPGPPYPDPIDGVRVYDYAEALSEDTIDSVEAAIASIEERTGAQIVVYTQASPRSDTFEEAEADAKALIDQWGIGRAGIDDGLAILLDLDESRCHGQVQLYAGPGYRIGHLDNTARQAIFEEAMLPGLRECDFDTAVTAAMDRVVAEGPRADPAPRIVLVRLITSLPRLIGVSP